MYFSPWNKTLCLCCVHCRWFPDHPEDVGHVQATHWSSWVQLPVPAAWSCICGGLWSFSGIWISHWAGDRIYIFFLLTLFSLNTQSGRVCGAQDNCGCVQKKVINSENNIYNCSQSCARWEVFTPMQYKAKKKSDKVVDWRGNVNHLYNKSVSSLQRGRQYSPGGAPNSFWEKLSVEVIKY